MEPGVNPYESPQGIEVTRRMPTEDIVLGRLRGPTVGLIVLAGFQAFALVGLLPLFSIRVLDREPLTFDDWVLPLSSIPSVFILAAAFRARQLKSLGLCRAGAIMACVPFVTPSVVLGIPFGIWATIVLFLPSTAAAFDQPQTLKEEAE